MANPVSIPAANNTTALDVFLEGAVPSLSFQQPDDSSAWHLGHLYCLWSQPTQLPAHFFFVNAVSCVFVQFSGILSTNQAKSCKCQSFNVSNVVQCCIISQKRYCCPIQGQWTLADFSPITSPHYKKWQHILGWMTSPVSENVSHNHNFMLQKAHIFSPRRVCGESPKDSISGNTMKFDIGVIHGSKEVKSILWILCLVPGLNVCSRVSGHFQPHACKACHNRGLKGLCYDNMALVKVFLNTGLGTSKPVLRHIDFDLSLCF